MTNHRRTAQAGKHDGIPHHPLHGESGGRRLCSDSGRGKISAEGTPLELKNTYTGDYITLYGVREEQLIQLGMPFEPIRDAFRVSVPNTAEATRLILQHPELFQDYEIIKGRMDDVFLAATGKKLTGGTGK